MANRVLRDWTQSESIDKLSPEAEIFFVRLIMKADDYGCYYGNPKLLNSALFPLKDYDRSEVCKWRDECANAKIIILYEVEQKQYIKIVDFGQRLRLMKSKFPQLEDNGQTVDGHLSDNGRPETKRNEVETKRKEGEDSLSFLGIDKSVEKLLADEYWHHSINHLTKGKDLGGAIRSSFAHIECQPSRFATATLNDLKKVTLSWLENKKPVTPDLKAISQKDRLKDL